MFLLFRHVPTLIASYRHQFNKWIHLAVAATIVYSVFAVGVRRDDPCHVYVAGLARNSLQERLRSVNDTPPPFRNETVFLTYAIVAKNFHPNNCFARHLDHVRTAPSTTATTNPQGVLKAYLWIYISKEVEGGHLFTCRKTCVCEALPRVVPIVGHFLAAWPTCLASNFAFVVADPDV